MGSDRLEALRREMKKREIDIYVVPTSDFHNSEYVGDYFKAREFLTGFTGSAGTAVVTSDKAGLWTDGRYFIQAAAEIRGSGFELYRMGMENVPTAMEFVEEELPKQGVIGFDGRVIQSAQAEELKKIADKKNGSLYVTEDLVDLIWEGRPAMSCTPMWILSEEWVGEPAAEKIGRIREKMKEAGADCHVVSCLYDIAWILNLRADDIENCPVFLSFLLVGSDDVTLFVQEEELTDDVREYLDKNGIRIAGYGEIYDALAGLPDDTAVLMDRGGVNYRIAASLPEHVRIIDRSNPSELMRAVKTRRRSKIQRSPT